MLQVHPFGRALDFRIPPNALGKISELKELLGDDYDVILEDNHIHQEYDPKG
jgi:hypothetical protein